MESEDRAAVERMYRRVLIRKPTEREWKIVERHLQGADDRQAAFEDLLWSLLNSAEFTTKH